jgi:3-hydroxyacyl-[acyl-carrier-protein] dehydratase
MSETETSTAVDTVEVMRRLPHRFPFLLVDRVLEWQSGKDIRAIKNVTINEPFFPGHFPMRPVMPGVLILEALAQTAGLLVFLTMNVYPDENTQFYFAGMDEVRFRRPVVPGDQLLLRATLERTLRGIWKFQTVAEVEGKEVTAANMLITPGKR